MTVDTIGIGNGQNVLQVLELLTEETSVEAEHIDLLRNKLKLLGFYFNLLFLSKKCFYRNKNHTDTCQEQELYNIMAHKLTQKHGKLPTDEVGCSYKHIIIYETISAARESSYKQTQASK